MKRVYTHENPVLVGLAKSLLEDAGLAVFIKNEFSATGMHPSYINQEVWVRDASDYDTAVELLENMREDA